MEEKKKKSKLKIIIPIVVIVAILAIVGIVVFTNAKMSKEEMLEVAQEMKYTELESDMKENQNRAKEKYNGNIYTFDSFISSIESDYITVATNNIKVYLDEEELNKLNNGQKISIVGKIDSLDYVSEDKMSSGFSYTQNNVVCDFRNAYVINDTFEVSGTIEIPSRELWVFTKDAANIVAESKERHGQYTKIIRKSDDWHCYLKADNSTYDLKENILQENRKFTEEGKTIIEGTEIGDKDNVKITGKIKKNGDKLEFSEIKSITLNQ